MNETTFPNDEVLGEALSRYAELLAEHGLDSREAEDFYESHKSVPRFMDLARECRRLESDLRSSSIGAKKKEPKRKSPVLAGVFYASAIPLLVFSGWYWSDTQVEQLREERDQYAATAKLSEERRVRDLALLFFRAYHEAGVAKERDWMATYGQPDDLDNSTVDAAPSASEPQEQLKEERIVLAENLAEGILEALEPHADALKRLRDDPNEHVRRGSELALNLLSRKARVDNLGL